MKKLKRIIPLLFVFILLSCSDVLESSIPYRAVYLELNVAYQDKVLNEIQGYKIYTSSNIDQAGEATGFGGVLVYHGISTTGADAYYAFDAACPYEAMSNVTIDVDDDAVYAVCPKCGSTYELLNGLGNPVSGPSSQYLKQYTVTTSGSTIYVTN